MNDKIEQQNTALDDRKFLEHQAKVATSAKANGAAVLQKYGNLFGKQDVHMLLDELADATSNIHKNDMKECEAMLFSQAQALQSIFTNLACQAQEQKHLFGFEKQLKLALKAQSQCRATLETLSAIKNPPVVFAKQANIANGHQQVNNGTTPKQSKRVAPARAGKKYFDENELLEQQDEKRMDTRTAKATSPAH